MKPILYFDHAATTRCLDSAAQAVQNFATIDYGNPASSHAYGRKAGAAIREARAFFAEVFGVAPDQVLFTSGGTEADNLAIYGVGLASIAHGVRPRILCSAIEHPAVRKTAQSLSDFKADVQLIPVDAQAQIERDALERLLTPETTIVSIQQVNNIVGSVLPVVELAALCKAKAPACVFHTDAIQAFGKVDSPRAGGPVDLISISSHKIHGPKGIGALIVLKRDLLKSLRPMLWGGEQEGGLRSGTQNAGLVSGFYIAARETLEKRAQTAQAVASLQRRFKEKLLGLELTGGGNAPLRWNSPKNALPQIVSLSYPSAKIPMGGALIAGMLEERGFMISKGSACSSKKSEPDAVLTAMGLAPEVCSSSFRVSFSAQNTLDDVDALALALDECLKATARLSAG